MFTKVKLKDGTIDYIASQQYSIGTYIIINNDSSKQFGVDDEEKIFHKKIRISILKDGGCILNGTFLNLKSKYPINDFKETEV
jgi:hypothetical protein